MRIHRDLLGWGVFFIVAGAIPLAIQAGIVPASVTDRWWSYWPLLLVGVGLGLILTRTPLEVLGGLVASATFGLMVGSALATGFGVAGFPSGVCGSDEGGVPFASQGGTLGADADVRIELDCGEVRIDTGAGDAWLLEGTDDDGRGPTIEAQGDRLEIRPSDNVPVSLLGERDVWEVTLPADTLMALDLELNAGRMTAALGSARLSVVSVGLNAGQAIIDLRDVAEIEGVEIELNAGELALDLPSHSMTGSIEVNAGSVRLCAPPDVALRLHTGDSILSSQDFGSAGLIERGDVWESPDYDTAPVRIELRTEANAGSFRLDPDEGCS